LRFAGAVVFDKTKSVVSPLSAKVTGVFFPPIVVIFETTVPAGGVPSRFVLEFVWRGLRLNEDIGSGSEVNRLVGELVR